MRALLLGIALLLASAIPALAADVLIVQSSNAPAYCEALAGFRSAFDGSTCTVVMTDYADVDVVRLVSEERPRVVLAVGDAALAACRKVRQVPVVSLMSLSFMSRPAGTNVGGVGIIPAPERYLNLFKAMGTERVGVLYDPDRTGAYVRRAWEAARELGLELVTREVRKPQETGGMLAQLEGEVELLWMLPDTTAVTEASLEGYFRFSREQGVPLVTFAGHYLDKGALIAVEADRLDLGRVVGDQIHQLLERRTDRPSVADARKVRLSTNERVAQELGITTSLLESISRNRGE